jgi:hypothetical protein
MMYRSLYRSVYRSQGGVRQNPFGIPLNETNNYQSTLEDVAFAAPVGSRLPITTQAGLSLIQGLKDCSGRQQIGLTIVSPVVEPLVTVEKLIQLQARRMPWLT